MKDEFNRNIEYIRLSVTDRCNLRCVYCMPEEGIELLQMSDLLTYEQIIRLCNIFASIGISNIKLTGGEPLVRKGLSFLVRKMKEIPGINEVTMTTNGILLGDCIHDLKDAGLDAVNISLDTLNEETFQKISRRSGVDKVIHGIDAAIKAGIARVKVNCVPLISNGNDDICAIASLAKDRDISVRFIEMMPIGLGKGFETMKEEDIRDLISRNIGKMSFYSERLGNGPAKYYSVDGFVDKIGFISAMSHEFCDTCNRIRLTADGYLKTCLFYQKGVDLKSLLESDITDDELTEVIKETIFDKPRGHKFHEDGPEVRKMSQIGG